MAFGGVEVAVEFVGGEVVEFFEDEGLGLLVREFAADLGEEVVGFGEAGFEGGVVLLEGDVLLQNSVFDLKRGNVWSKLDSLKREPG